MLFSFFFLAAVTPMVPPIPEEIATKRIHEHLLICDPTTACEEAKSNVQKYPNYLPLLEAYVTALAKAGRENEMMQAWNQYAAINPNAYKNRELLENMAWGVISQAANSSSPIIRTVALLGAFFGQDAKGVEILHKHLNDNNSFLRGVAVQLAAQLRDAKLCDGVLNLFRKEKDWGVHLQAIKALGKMHITAAKPELISIISSSNAAAEEKAAAIQSLVYLLETASRDDVAHLATSDRAGLRLLACEVVQHCDLRNELDYIFPLLYDHSSEVRAAALQVFGVLRIKDHQNQRLADVAAFMLNDPDSTVAITAAWVIILEDYSQGQKAFERWLVHENRRVRILAAAALGASGKYGLPYMLEAFRNSQDSFVKMNLALSLIRQRSAVNEACMALYEGLTVEKSRWMWNEDTIFRALVPTTIAKKASGDESPEATDQLARLEILSMLAMLEDSHAKAALTDFLDQQTWGISGLAAALLLTEGDDASIDLVKTLLTHPSQKIRIQAALILSLWGKDESAIAVLKESYKNADRDLKERILEGIGRIGELSTIPFLVDKLQEPFPTLRIIAATALLQCLYH